MTKNYRLASTSLNSEWDAFISTSTDGSVFMSSVYLKHTGLRLGLYKCYNAQELRAVIGVVESPDGKKSILDDLVIYSGICFGPPTHGQSRAQQISERHELANFIANALAERYDEIKFALAPSIDDIRPFLWYNYGQETNRFNVDVRYTSYLSIANFATAKELEDIDIYHQATGARRQQIRYARRVSVVTEEFWDVGAFIDFYSKTLQRQSEKVDLNKLDRMSGLIMALLENDSAKMFSARTSDGSLGSIAVYAFDSRRAYYLFGASDPALRNTPTGTAILWDAFHALSKQGIKEIDLEGVNSPYRGWFKLSFGGSLVSYYQVSFVRNGI